MDNLKNFFRKEDGHDYIVHADKIGYKEPDGTPNYNRIDQCKTMWAFFLEHEDYKVTRSSLDE